ncbi:MAG TPA: 30S ribosomal protein S12 methylthiotransferase RimO [Thermoanaerobaculia bacterium]|jgi:ribosomal protein S12 methylthiotransferase|nr:30S ribosomal protein S12 methylthiotransferase RimO [Thermoanaerobaculia bacterium]
MTVVPSENVRRVGMISLGCPKNLVDAEIMLGQLQADAGHVVITNDLAEADVVIVNTCGFIDAAKQESIDTILEIAGKKGHGVERLIVTGCMVQKYRTELQEAIPEIDGFVGLDNLEKITEAVTGKAADDLAPTRRKMSQRLYEDFPRVLTQGTAHAYLKVSEGCSNPCTFCSIPQMRGKFRSRNIDALVREALQLQNFGVKELNLVAQDTTRYGEDIGLEHGLTHLVERLIAETNFRWIRFLYAYPGSIDWTLFELMGREPRFASYVDIPLQHVSANVLGRMRRPGSPKQYKEMIRRMRELVPDLTLRTTFITGHPGETPKDFGELQEFVEWAQFDNMGAFTYSAQDSTLSARMTDTPTPKTAERRRAKLMEIQQKIALSRNEQKVGQSYDALITGIFEETENLGFSLYEGRIIGQAPEIDGRLLINDGIELLPESLPAFARVEITDAHPYDLVGAVIQ